MSYGLIPPTTATIKRQNNNKFLPDVVGIHCWWECKLVQSLWKMIERLLKKNQLKLELLYDPAIQPLAIYPKELKSLHQRAICTPMFITELLTKDKIQIQLR
jgi:hypothetical protein